MTALVQLDAFDGQVWINPLGVLSIHPEQSSVLIQMTGGWRVILPVPKDSSPEGHARMVVGKINTGLVAEFK